MLFEAETPEKKRNETGKTREETKQYPHKEWKREKDREGEQEKIELRKLKIDNIHVNASWLFTFYIRIHRFVLAIICVCAICVYVQFASLWNRLLRIECRNQWQNKQENVSRRSRSTNDARKNTLTHAYYDKWNVEKEREKKNEKEFQMENLIKNFLLFFSSFLSFSTSHSRRFFAYSFFQSVLFRSVRSVFITCENALCCCQQFHLVNCLSVASIHLVRCYLRRP